LLFHHDPHHTDDQLDENFQTALSQWLQLGRDPEAIAMATEHAELRVDSQM
jgi:hypothetical protein